MLLSIDILLYCCFCVNRLRVPVGCTTELNHLGHQFLQQLFEKYDEVSSNSTRLLSKCSPGTVGKIPCSIVEGFVLNKCFFIFLGQRLCSVTDGA